MCMFKPAGWRSFVVVRHPWMQGPLVRLPLIPTQRDVAACERNAANEQASALASMKARMEADKVNALEAMQQVGSCPPTFMYILHSQRTHAYVNNVLSMVK